MATNDVRMTKIPRPSSKNETIPQPPSKLKVSQKLFVRIILSFRNVDSLQYEKCNRHINY